MGKPLNALELGWRRLLPALGLQIVLWFFLTTHIPMTQLQYTVPSFSYDATNHRLCMVLRASGSHGGQAVGDTFCIDAESGELSQLSVAQRMADLEQANPEGGRRKLTQSPDGSFRLTTFDTDRQRVQEERELDLPGYTPTLVNDRYLVSHDETRIYVWDAQAPDAPVKSLPAPVTFSYNPSIIRGSDRFYYVTRVAAAKPPNRAVNTSPLPDVVAPIEQGTNLGESSLLPPAPSPFGGGPSPVVVSPKAPTTTELRTRKLYLFGVTPEDGPLLIGSWTALSRSEYSFDSIATPCENELATIAASEATINFHSIADGSLVRQQPLPVGFDPLGDKWFLEAGRLDVRGGNDRKWDLQANAWLPSPGEDYRLQEELRDAGLGLYWGSNSGGQWNIFDQRRGKSLVQLPASTGTPVFMDDQKFAICSASYGFRAELMDLRRGSRLQTWTPWWWVPPVLAMAMLTYAIWSWAWVTWAAQRDQPAWIDVAIIAGIFIAVFTYRLHITGGPERSFSYGYSIPEQAIRGVICALLVMATCGIFVGKTVFFRRLLLFAFLVASAGALLRFLLVYTPQSSAWASQSQSAAVYEDAWTALASIIPVVGLVVIACWLALAVGFRLRNCNESPGMQLERVRPGQFLMTKNMAWRIADLLLLTAGCAALLQVFGPYAATAREELQMLHGNEVFGEFMLPISKAGLLTAALAFGGLAKGRWVFLLAGLVAATLVLALAIEPILEFAVNGLDENYRLGGQHQRFMLTCPAATFLVCLPYRFRGWRFSWR